MNKTLCLLTVTLLAAQAMAAGKPYNNADECKAYYGKLEADAKARLDEKRKALGPGMPMMVYSDRLSRIEAKYKANLKKCSKVSGT